MVSRFWHADAKRAANALWSRLVANNQIVRFKRRSEFISVTKEGKRFHVNDWLMLNSSKSEDNEIKVGWTVPGYVGTAVTRNRLKRWLREYVEKKWRPQRRGLIVHFLFKRRAVTFYKGLDHRQFDKAVENGLKHVEKTPGTKK